MSTTTTNLGLFKYNPSTDGNLTFSITNALNNNWDIIDEAYSKSRRNIGEIVQSTIPLTDAGLHLLDGALISGCGGYGAFVDYIAGLDQTANYFCTEQEWQDSVTQYGVCGKFVYDDVNNTVRLPKITGVVEGTTDITALGNLVEAGLPNITGVWNVIARTTNETKSGCCDWSLGNYNQFGGDKARGTNQMSINASSSNPIYGNSTTVQPQTIKTFYYIVIATSAKTDIQVDIDLIVSDLNNKVNISDLSEVQCVIETYSNGDSWYRIYSDGWCEQGGTATVATNANPDVNNTIILLKSYANTNYTVVIGGKDGRSTASREPGAKIVSTSSFAILTGDDAVNFYWVTYGYIS